MQLLIFESHATSCDNEKGIASGDLDSPLSQKGVLQAQELGERYADQSIHIVCCSDLIRSYATAQIAFSGTNAAIIKDKRLREWNYGLSNGRPAMEVDKLKSSYIYEPFPGGESLVSALARVKSFEDEIYSQYPHEPILFIGHRIVYYALEHRHNRVPLEDLVTKPWRWQPGWRYQRF